MAQRGGAACAFFCATVVAGQVGRGAGQAEATEGDVGTCSHSRESHERAARHTYTTLLDILIVNGQENVGTKLCLQSCTPMKSTWAVVPRHGKGGRIMCLQIQSRAEGLHTYLEPC